MSKITRVLQNAFKKQGIIISIYSILLLILMNAVVTYQYKKALDSNQAFRQSIDEIVSYKEGILSNLNTTDMSIRGYLLVKNDVFLDTYNRVRKVQEEEFKTLDNRLLLVGFDVAQMDGIQNKLNEYYNKMDEVVELDRIGDTEQALNIIREDHGTAVWETYVEFGDVLDSFLENLQNEKQASYDRLFTLNLVFNILLFIVGVPTLFFAAYRLKVNGKKRNVLYQDLDNKNRELIFDSNQKINMEDEVSVVGSILENLKKTASFIKEITKGNYEIKWEGLNADNQELNKNNIAGELLIMRNQMKKREEETKRQNWVNEGLAKLSEILREHQDDLYKSADKTLGFIVNYLGAQQGGLFMLIKDENTDEKYLELASCYAFNRKKFLEKRIEIGQGMIGQAFLEAEPIYITDIPEDYISITSGLGDARPRCLLLFPLKHNEKVEAIIEIASFIKYDKFAMEFLESASKTIASSIASIRTNQQTKQLLEQSQQQAEEMKAQEEEMRQNMEELEATQEEMKRKESELRILLAKNNQIEG